jgi:hypothetical protein
MSMANGSGRHQRRLTIEAQLFRASPPQRLTPVPVGSDRRERHHLPALTWPRVRAGQDEPLKIESHVGVGAVGPLNRQNPPTSAEVDRDPTFGRDGRPVLFVLILGCGLLPGASCEVALPRKELDRPSAPHPAEAIGTTCRPFRVLAVGEPAPRWRLRCGPPSSSSPASRRGSIAGWRRT